MSMRFRMECDGGSRGNPGLAGSGASVRDARAAIRNDDTELGACWTYIRHATNNFAEYTSLITGLELVLRIAKEDLEIDPAQATVDVFMDSKLVVQQMSGKWKIKHPDLIPLANQVKQLERLLGKVTYTWIPRAQNARADELANRAMDTKESGSFTSATTPASAEPQPETPPQGEDTSAASPATSPLAQVAAPSWKKDAGPRPTRLLLVRHGETKMSAEGRFSGHGDPELTANGRQQAKKVGAYLAQLGTVDAIVASPLGRAQQTAEAIAAACGIDAGDIETHDGLIEMNFGSWEGKTFGEVDRSELAVPEGAAGQADDHAALAPPGGESPNAVYERLGGVVDDITGRYAGKTVVVVSHVTPIKSVLRRALQVDGSIFKTLHLDLASLSVIDVFADDTTLVRLANDTHYLYV